MRLRLGGLGEGPGRERHDRRPAPQRPGARGGDRIGARRSAPRGGAAAHRLAAHLHGLGAAAPRGRPGGPPRRHLPVRLGDRRAQGGGDAARRGPGGVATRGLLRRGGRHRAGRRRLLQRGHPHRRGGSRDRGGGLRDGRGDHLGLRPRPPSGTRRSPRPASSRRTRGCPRCSRRMRLEGGRVALLDGHLARLSGSARYLGISLDPAAVRARLAGGGRRRAPAPPRLPGRRRRGGEGAPSRPGRRPGPAGLLRRAGGPSRPGALPQDHPPGALRPAPGRAPRRLRRAPREPGGGGDRGHLHERWWWRSTANGSLPRSTPGSSPGCSGPTCSRAARSGSGGSSPPTLRGRAGSGS